MTESESILSHKGSITAVRTRTRHRAGTWHLYACRERTVRNQGNASLLPNGQHPAKDRLKSEDGVEGMNDETCDGK
jgi:hypothetical protein